MKLALYAFFFFSGFMVIFFLPMAMRRIFHLSDDGFVLLALGAGLLGGGFAGLAVRLGRRYLRGEPKR